MLDQHHRVNREAAEWLRAQSLQDELGRVRWHGEQVYRMPAHNAIASWALVDQLKPLLPKDNQQAASQVKQLYALLAVATLTDNTLVQ
jgi:hypothetical protein